MKFIYKNQGSLPNQPLGPIFECEADDILVADELFLTKFELKKFTQKECRYVLVEIQKEG